MKRFLVLTLPAFVVSCERAAVRDYEAPKETFPQKAAVREPDRAGAEFCPDLRDQFEGASGLATAASGADADGQLCRRGSRRGEGGYFCDELSG